MKVFEVQKLNEYGDTKWNWFTTDPIILVDDWAKDLGDEGREMADEHIDALDLLDLWEGHWHLLQYAPEGYTEPPSPDEEGAADNLHGAARSNPTRRRFTKGVTVGSPGGDTIQMGPQDPDNVYGGTMPLDGAIILDNRVAVWWGDDSTWN